MYNLAEQIKQKTIGLPEKKAQFLEKTFTPMLSDLKLLENEFNSIVAHKEVTKEITLDARELRLKIARIRIAADKVRKKEKEEFLMAGRAIDGMANIIKHQVISKEKKLEEIEHYFIIEREKKTHALSKLRLNEISDICDKYNGTPLGLIPSLKALGMMDAAIWDCYKKGLTQDLEKTKKAEEEQRQRQEKEKKEEQARQEELKRNYELELKRTKELENKLKKEREALAIELERKEAARVSARKAEIEEQAALQVLRDAEIRAKEEVAKERKRLEDASDIEKVQAFGRSLHAAIEKIKPPVIKDATLEQSFILANLKIKQLIDVMITKQ